MWIHTDSIIYIHSTLHTMSVVSGGGGEVKLLVVAPL